MDVLSDIHQWLGYAVLVVLLVAAASAIGRGRASRAFDPSWHVGAVILLDIQVLLGAVVYVADAFWEAGWMSAWVHPVLMLLALGVGHASVSRARRLRMVDDAWRTLGRGLGVAVVLVVAGIGVASAA